MTNEELRIIARQALVENLAEGRVNVENITRGLAWLASPGDFKQESIDSRFESGDEIANLISWAEFIGARHDLRII